MESHLQVECRGLEKLQPKQLAGFGKGLFKAIESVDSFLVACLDGNYACRHHLKPESTYACPQFDISFSGTESLDADKIALLHAYLAQGRHAIFTTDYNQNNCVDELLPVLTEAANETDAIINPQVKLFDSKILNRVALCKTIQQVTSIPEVGKSNLVFRLIAGEYQGEITSLTRQKAEDLLGGKSIDKKSHWGHFILSDIPFADIERRCKFIFDGQPIVAYITDKSWIAKFNAEGVSLTKNDRLKARALIERSPLSKKAVVYYFIKVDGINV